MVVKKKVKKEEVKIKKSKMSKEELEDSIEEIESFNNSMDKRPVIIKASKPVSKIVKGDKIKVDGKEFEVDAHYVLIDHKTTKEMAIEMFDPKTDKDYQLRYFSDQAETTMDFYELQEIIYIKKTFEKVEW